MSYEDLVYCCRKLVALHDAYDELWFMRIHNETNCKAFNKNIEMTIREIKELCKEELND